MCLLILALVCGCLWHQTWLRFHGFAFDKLVGIHVIIISIGTTSNLMFDANNPFFLNLNLFCIFFSLMPLIVENGMQDRLRGVKICVCIWILWRISQPLQLVHADICGPMQTLSHNISSSRPFVDDFNRGILDIRGYLRLKTTWPFLMLFHVSNIFSWKT